jgi:hypothetical protein
VNEDQWQNSERGSNAIESAGTRRPCINVWGGRNDSHVVHHPAWDSFPIADSGGRLQ